MVAEKIRQLISLPNTYIGEAPIAVDNCQWIRSMAGDSTTYFTKETYDRPAFSIYVRGENNREASVRCEDIFKRIRNHSDSLNSLLAKRLPAFVGKDEKHRSVYTFSIEFQTGGY